MFYSVMNHLPGPQHQAFKELLGLEDFVTKKVEENQRTLDPNSPRHFIDSFLIRMREVHPAARAQRSQARQMEIGDNRVWVENSRGLLKLSPSPHTP